jgi:hypothetical protein
MMREPAQERTLLAKRPRAYPPCAPTSPGPARGRGTARMRPEPLWIYFPEACSHLALASIRLGDSNR